MAPSDTNISKIHTILLGLTGLSCLLYAILAVTQNTPQPIWWFVAIAMGVFAGISTFVAFAMADPASRRYGAGGVDKPLLIIVHGSGWYGMKFHGLARELATQADVVVLDLRGHGVTPHRRGDIDYIN